MDLQYSKDIILKILNLLLHDQLISSGSKKRILFIKALIEEDQSITLKQQLNL